MLQAQCSYWRPLMLALLVTLSLGHLVTLSSQGADPTSDESFLKDHKVAIDGPGLLEFFRQRTAKGNEEERIKSLIKKLGDDAFEVREDASRQLVAIGRRARGLLTKALMDSDPEVQNRAQECLKQVEEGATSAVIRTAARVLAHKKPPAAAEVLLDYLPSAEDDGVAEEVRQVLPTLAVRDGKAEPVLVKALADRSPEKRSAAAMALIRADVADQREASRKLLSDPEAVVRLRVGLALVNLKEKEPMPVLIALLADAPLSVQETGIIEDILYRLAEDKAPSPVPGGDPASRRQYRDAWAKWWQDNGKTIDLAKLSETAKTLGLTTVVLLDQGQVIDLDNANKPRWTVGNLEFPLDVQYLPGDRVLVAEHNASRVTERTKDNKIVWEKKVDSPLVSQRLPNGNTFIATRTQLLEVDAKGNEVFTYTRPGGEVIMRAQKLRNGDIAMITQQGVMGVTRFVRMNQAGKDLSGFGVDVRTSGGRVDVLPNGHVLIPENGNNRVVEHDAQGKIVWEATVEQPIMAMRLPNGNTMVTSMNTDIGAVELDRRGKELWRYKAETRVTRAYRR